MQKQHRMSIFETIAAKMTVNNLQLTELVNFIMQNRSVRLNPSEVKSLTNIRTLSDTPISRTFSRAMELGLDRIFSFCKIPLTMPIPEVLTYQHITFDLDQLEPVAKNLYDSIIHTPGFSGTIVENITSMVRQSGELTDSLGFQGVCVRDMLSRSYYENTSTMWLTPSLIRYLSRCYNMSLSAVIATTFDLDWFEKQSLGVILTYYFLQKVSNSVDAEAMIRSGAKLDLPQSIQTNEVISRMKEALGDRFMNMSFDDVCTAINNLGINRLSNVNKKLIFTKCQTLGPDLYTTVMALEYPPYFAYIILLATSGRKIGMYNRLKNSTLEKEARTFADDLIRSQSFLPSL